LDEQQECRRSSAVAPCVIVSARPADSSLIHPTYRYLDRPIRIAGLTLVHWAHLALAGCGAWALAKLLPFGATYDLSVALSLTGAPAATAIAAGTAEANPFRYLRDVARWQRTRAVYAQPPGDRLAALDVQALWD
jgi:hypothetical protein